MVGRARLTGVSSGAPETSIVYYSSGGHSHNGVNSTLIDTSKYSIFDFNPSVGVGSDSNRLNSQTTNFNSFKNFVISTVNDAFISPQGVVIRANTITADAIVSNTITAEQLSAELILVNNIIKSNNFVSGSSGWQIAYDGSAEFSNVTVRGKIESASGNIGAWTLTSTVLSTSYFDGGIPGNTSELQLGANGQIYARTYAGSIYGSGYYNETFLNKNSTDYGNFIIRGNGSGSYLQTRIAPSVLAVGETGGSGGGGTSITGTSLSVGNTTIDANINIGNGQTVKATTSFRTTGSSTTARMSQGDVSGYDVLARPTSLRELKENIEDIDDGLGILLDLRPRKYNFRVDAFSPVDPNTQQPWTDQARELSQLDIKYGFIVDEILEKRPELISYSHEHTNEDPYGPGGYFDLSSWKPTMWEDIDVVVLSVKAIQQLNDKIESLEARIQELEGL